MALFLSEPEVLKDLTADSLAFDPDFQRDFLYEHICSICPFLIDGCDFTSPDPPDNCLPCGGMIVLSWLLKQGTITDDTIARLDLRERYRDAYLSFTPHCSLKRLEEDYLYDIVRDDLYEVNDEAAAMLARCDGSRTVAELQPTADFLEFCVEEDLLQVTEEPEKHDIVPGKAPTPSLRYLEWVVTRRCNLACRHCYLGDSEDEELPPELIEPLLEQFTAMHGLRVLISGGEPLLYRHFDMLNEKIRNYPLRFVLLTNGMLLTKERAHSLNVHEIQISLDGMEKGHELIRGKGSFDRVVAAMEAVRHSGKDLSVATMIHSGNTDEWDEMVSLITGLGAREWSIDYPCVKGRWQEHPDLAVDPAVAAEKMEYGFGASYHGTSPGWTCGRHLAAVLPSGEIVRCGLFPEAVHGNIRDGLAEAWSRIDHIPVDRTECAGCEYADTCGGGCRFRAGGRSNRDVVMCHLYGKLV